MERIEFFKKDMQEKTIDQLCTAKTVLCEQIERMQRDIELVKEKLSIVDTEISKKKNVSTVNVLKVYKHKAYSEAPTRITLAVYAVDEATGKNVNKLELINMDYADRSMLPLRIKVLSEKHQFKKIIFKGIKATKLIKSEYEVEEI